MVGRPNVGKSTLVNALVGEKVAITSTRPQTTRNRIRAVLNGDDHQIVLIDTPGVHKPRTELGSRLNSLVYRTLGDADTVLFVIDATQQIGPGDRLVAERLIEAKAVVVLAVNKTDDASHGQIVSQLETAAEWDFAAYVPVSALAAANLDPLRNELINRMPEGPALFPLDAVSDQPEHILVAELVREKFLDRLRDELPHSLVVVVDDIEERDSGAVVVTARAIVERDSQKGIVIGKGGSLLATAGREAREELEQVFAAKVHLELRVVVEADWQQRPAVLDRLGFVASDE